MKITRIIQASAAGVIGALAWQVAGVDTPFAL